MKPGKASRTAELVCMGRAVAHARSEVDRFHDPVALTMLSLESRARVASALGERTPTTLRGRVFSGYLRRQAAVMAVRTVAIDDAVRAGGAPQVVILGAGLDGRAWRMTDLADAVVFEVDHPDTQKNKRERVRGLGTTAKEVRFVAVDFERDELDVALAEAGHDSTKPTTWIWEGVVMYLTLADIEQTLAVIRARSAPGSAVVIVYHRPAWLLWVVGPIVGRLGEPLKSRFTPEEMRRLLERHGMTVASDKDIAELALEMSTGLGERSRAVRHLRIVVGTR